MAPVKRRGCCEQGHLWRRESAVSGIGKDDVRLDDGRTSTILVLHAVIKLIASILAFALVLCGCVVAKASLLLMVANILPPRRSDTSDDAPSVNPVPRTAAAGWYWAVLFIVFIPELIGFIQAFKNVMSRRPAISRPQCSYVLLVVTMELLHIVGLALLLYLILPRLDSFVASTLTTAVIFVPSILRILYYKSSPPSPSPTQFPETRTHLAQLKHFFHRLDPSTGIDLLAGMVQLAGFACLPTLILPYTQNDDPSSSISHAQIVFYGTSWSCIMISCVWWENFVTDHSALPILQRLHKLSRKNHSRRCCIQLFLIPLKMAIFTGLMILFYRVNSLSDGNDQKFSDDMHDLGRGFLDFFSSPAAAKEGDADLKLTYSISVGSAGVQIHDYWIVMMVQVIAAGIAVQVGTFACQTLMQCFAFSLPAVMASPLLVIVMGILTHVDDGPTSLPYYYKSGVSYPNFKPLDHFSKWTDVFSRSYIWLWLMWYFSFIWITRHIWTNRNPVRLAKPETLFALPKFTGIFVDQHMACSRRLNEPIAGHHPCLEDGVKVPNCLRNLVRETWPGACRKKVYTCVTMWHESKSEMSKLIGSLVGLDEKQAKPAAAPSPTANAVEITSDGYDLECHVFFDDAFNHDITQDHIHPELFSPIHSALRREIACTCPLLPTDTTDSHNLTSSSTHQPTPMFFTHLVQSTVNVIMETTGEKMEGVKLRCPLHASRTKLELINSYVKQFLSLLVRTMDTSDRVKSHVTFGTDLAHVREVHVPYGACYVWRMRHGTQLYLHLKDTKKVKKRKRWSQVMYLHYIENILMQSMDVPGRDTLSEKCRKMFEAYEKERRAANTFVLALDGDMEFKPSTVQLLLDFMKRDSKLGAVCGRIHPTGGGPVVWYQQFEYATSQWLQKTTEQVIGSVLCSPGCFSLYRADALLHHKVISKYSRKPEEAMECLKYDQGEDRWLCTLMLKAGYRIRYCALAFAKTKAPVSFDELFNQRRRWISSSTANLIEILQNGRKLIKRNEHISYAYIMYQLIQLLSTVLSPGVTVLMLDQSLSIAFSIGNLPALTLAVAPVLIFTIVCLKASEKFQLLVAQVLSIAYAILMVGEVVGLAMQFTSAERFTSPTTVLVLLLLSIFLATAFMHPRSFTCYFHGVLYFFWIPSMFILLPIYSLCNLDNLSWGTREDRIKPNQTGTTGNSTAGAITTNAESGWRCSLGPALQCICCRGSQAETTGSLQVSDDMRVVIAQNAQILRELASSPASSASPLLRSTTHSNPRLMPTRTSRIPLQDSVSLSRPTYSSILQEQEFNKIDSMLQEAPLYRFPAYVDTMWSDLILGRLRPDPSGPPSRSRIRLDTKLHELRDRAVLIFFAVNGLIVALVYLLQNNTDLYLTVPWPWGGFSGPTPRPPGSRDLFDMAVDESVVNLSPPAASSLVPTTTPLPATTSRRHLLQYDPTTKSVQVEPIGVLFVLGYVAVLILQFFCMLVHRMITFTHLLASTDYKTAIMQRIKRRDSRRRTRRGRSKIHRSNSEDSFGNYHCDCPTHDDPRNNGKIVRSSSVDQLDEMACPEDAENPSELTLETDSVISSEKIIFRPADELFRGRASLPAVDSPHDYAPLRMFASNKEGSNNERKRHGERKERRRGSGPRDTSNVTVPGEAKLTESSGSSDGSFLSINYGKRCLSRQEHVVVDGAAVHAMDDGCSV